MNREERIKIAIVVAIVLMALFFMMGQAPVSRIQEIRVLDTARTMVESNQYVVPYFNGDIRFEKPPLAYWASALGYLAFGNFSEWAARFFSAVCSFIGLSVLFTWLRKELDINTAALAVVCLVSTLVPLQRLRDAETDPLLITFSIIAAYFAFKMLYKNTQSKESIGFYAFMGLGALSKGPPALIPLAVLIVTAIKNKSVYRLKKLISPVGIILFALIAGAWYAYLYHHMPDVLMNTVSQEANNTYVEGDHNQPFYYYVFKIWGYYAPWAIVMAPAIYYMYKQRATLPAVVEFCLNWFLVAFLFLSLNPNKQAHYSFLLAPSFSVLMGYYLVVAQGAHRKVINIFLAASAVIFTVALGWLLIKLDNIGSVRYLPLLLMAGLGYLWHQHKSEAVFKTIAVAGLMTYTLTLGMLWSDIGAGKEPGILKTMGLEAKQQNFKPLFFFREYDPTILYYAHDTSAIPVLRDEQKIRSQLQVSSPIYIFIAKKKEHLLPEQLTGETVLENKFYKLVKFSQQR